MGRIFLPLIAFMLAVAPLSSLANTMIVMVFGNGYPPFYDFESREGGGDNLMWGAYVDFLAAFEREHPEYDIEKVRLPRLRMDQWVRDGKADAFSLNSPLFTSEEDKKAVDFSLPIWTSSDHLVVLATSTIESVEFDQLRGKRIGLVYGNGYGQLDALIDSGEIKAQRVYNADQLPGLMLADRVDCYVGNRHVEPFIWRQTNHDAALFKMLMPPLYEFDLSVAVRKNNRQFLSDLNAFIEQSRNNGFLESINRKYFSDAMDK